MSKAAVFDALHLAPSLAQAKPGEWVQRGIDLELTTEAETAAGKTAVAQALGAAGYENTVSVWLWTARSGGTPTTNAGFGEGKELRLAPHRGSNPSRTAG